MKGIMLSAILWIHSMVIVVGLVWMVAYEHTRYQVVSAQKNALRSTMSVCATIPCDENQAFEIYSSFIEPSLRLYTKGSWELMGFHQDPMLIRIKVKVVDKRGVYPIEITSDEAIIQEIDYE